MKLNSIVKSKISTHTLYKIIKCNKKTCHVKVLDSDTTQLKFKNVRYSILHLLDSSIYDKIITLATTGGMSQARKLYNKLENKQEFKDYANELKTMANHIDINEMLFLLAEVLE